MSRTAPPQPAGSRTLSGVSGPAYTPLMASPDLSATVGRTTRRPQAKQSSAATVPADALVPAGPPLSELEFIGCKAVPMTYEQFRRYDGRLEVWDAETRTAWMVREPTSADHESPSQDLAGLSALIAAVRGSPIACYGSMDLLVHGAQGKPQRIMQADQTVYLRPSRAELSDAGTMVVGRHHYPDVVLEVDHTTDIRRGKLKLYEAWGFPELWVEVPEHRPPSRPKNRKPGLTIHLLEGGVYRESPESVAFPGWRAEDVHLAMHESRPSARTGAILERLGRRLGAREGTGPDHHPLMRSLRDQSRAEGERKGRVEGREKSVRQILRLRGVEVPEGFPAGVPGFADLPEEVVVAAALACESGRDFLARIRRR